MTGQHARQHTRTHTPGTTGEIKIEKKGKHLQWGDEELVVVGERGEGVTRGGRRWGGKRERLFHLTKSHIPACVGTCLNSHF